MTQLKTLWRSFASGEITPELFGRLDLSKYQTGLDTCRNAISLPHGPVANRPGFAYVLEVKDSTKATALLPFVYSTAQAYVLEFGDQYLRIHTQGATVLEASQAITNISQADPGVLTYTGADPTNGQWFYLSGIGGMVQLNGRYVKVKNVNAGANTFELSDAGGANINTLVNHSAYTSGGSMSRVYEIATPYAEADLFDLHFTQSADVLTIVHPSYQQRELRRLGATNWTLTTFTLSPTQVAPASATATATVATGAGFVTQSYQVTAIAEGTQEESLPTAAASCSNNLATAGNYNTVTWPAAAGAVRYNVYKEDNGLFGYVGQASDGTTGFKDDNINPDVSQTPPEDGDPFTGAGSYPGAVGYFKGRRWFAGTQNGPHNLWATRSGTESNMNYSIPTREDDRIAVKLTARQANTIRHIVPLSELLLLTSGAEWLITSQNSDAITPTTIDYKTQGYIGANNVQPIVTSKAVLYSQDRGGHVRELLYKWESSGYETNDISIMAPHLFDGYSITGMAYTRSPVSVAWFVRSDGVLLGCTYVPEHQVVGWHRHDTNGFFEAVVAVPEGEEDVLYAVVRRTVNGRTVRYIERLHTRMFSALSEAFFVDSGLTYSGSPATVISGLHHLEGEEVSVLADGAVVQGLTVDAGSITLPEAAEEVHIGLAYTADVKTLPLVFEAQALGQGTEKNVNEISLRVRSSSSIFAGPTVDRLREYRQRTTEPYGSPPNLITGTADIAVDPSWGPDAQVCVRQEKPLPLMLLAMVVKVAVGG